MDQEDRRIRALAIGNVEIHFQRFIAVPGHVGDIRLERKGFIGSVPAVRQ